MKKYLPEEVQASFSFSVPIQVRLSDIDGYMHVNNGIYFNYFEHARALYLYQACGWDVMDIGTVVANIQINYRKPIHAEDSPEVYVKCCGIGRSSFVLEQVILGKNKAGEWVVFAESTTTMVSVDMKTMRPVPVPEAYASKLRSS
jgi:acyl-CoA thioester hydrolase